MSHRILPRKKRNIIWKFSKLELENAIQSAFTFADILKSLNLNTSSRNYKVIQAKLDHENISYAHIAKGLGTNKNKVFGPRPRIATKDILIENSNFSRISLKKRLLRDGILKNECYVCGMLPEWQGKLLSLQIDHINGIHDDNRLENLRIICPNCHAQTETFSGKNVKKNR